MENRKDLTISIVIPGGLPIGEFENIRETIMEECGDVKETIDLPKMQTELSKMFPGNTTVGSALSRERVGHMGTPYIMGNICGGVEIILKR